MPSDNELMKQYSGGAITKAEYEKLMAMPHAERYKNMPMKKPEKAAGGPPKRIGADMGSPGGPYTPGAKMERQKAAAAAMRVGSKKIKLKDGKPSNPHRGAYSTGGTVSGSVGGGT